MTVAGLWRHRKSGFRFSKLRILSWSSKKLSGSHHVSIKKLTLWSTQYSQETSPDKPRYYGTTNFMTLFTAGCQLSPSWARLIQSKPSNSISWRYMSILISNLRLAIPSGLHPSSSPNKCSISLSALPQYVQHPPIRHLFNVTTFSKELKSLQDLPRSRS